MCGRPVTFHFCKIEPTLLPHRAGPLRRPDSEMDVSSLRWEKGWRRGRPDPTPCALPSPPHQPSDKDPCPGPPGATVDASMLPRTPVLKPGCRFQKSWCPPHTQESVLIRLGGAEEPRLCVMFLQHFIVKNVQPIEK